MFTIIAAVGKNNELGKDNDLIFHIKEDMKFFREKTTGHKVVMGFNTWKSLPGKLKNRENIVVSYDDVNGPDLVIKDIAKFIKDNKDTDEEIFIIGGGMIYREFLPYAKTLYLTEVEKTDPAATIFFPNFDKSKYQRKIIKKGSENGLEFQMVQYRHIGRTRREKN